MSFTEQNQYFIRIKFHSEMNGLTMEEKIERYNGSLKEETRSRLKDYFAKSLPLKEKVTAYEEVLILLKNFEFEYLLLSIYFEGEANDLFNCLEKKLSECAPKGSIDRFGLLKLVREEFPLHNGSKVKGFLKSFFIKMIDLRLNEWENEDEKRNDLINRLNHWLEKELLERQKDEEVLVTLLHYSKLWNIYFSKPYNYLKGIVLLNGISNVLSNEISRLGVNFNEVLSNLESKLSTLLCQVIRPPFLDSADVARFRDSNVSKGYLKRLEEFKAVVNESAKFFIDIENKSFTELVDLYFESTEPIQKVLHEKIKEKLLNGSLPEEDELRHFENGGYRERIYNDSQGLFQSFIRMNYWFEQIKFE